MALLYCGLGLLPGRVFAPVDLVNDAGAWKGDLTSRVPVSNSLLSDVPTQFMAWDAEAVRLLRGGELPWRNRWAGEGAPLFANPQTALLDPFTWPRLLFGEGGWVICAMLRMIVAGLTMRWLVRVMGGGRRAAVVSGFVYATSGYGVLWLLYPIANVFAVLPGLAASALLLVREPRPRHALLVTLFAALATVGGHPETLLCGVLGIAALVVWESRRVGRLALAALAGFLLCGVMLVPFAKLALESDTRAVRAAAIPFGVRWNALAGTILPGFLGSPLKGEIDLTALQSLPENFILRSEEFVGLIVLVVILLEWRAVPPLFRRGLLLALGGFVLALRLPLLRLIPHVVPMAVEYMTFVFVLFLAAAAGPAFALLDGARRTGRALLIVGILLAGGAGFVALPAGRPLVTSVARSGIARLRARGVLHKPGEVYEARLNGYLEGATTTAVRRALIPGLCWALAGFGLATRRRNVVAFAAAAELLAFGIGFNPAVERVGRIPEPVMQLHRLDPTGEYFAASNNEVFPSNLGTLYGTRDVVSYDSLQSHARVEALMAGGLDRVTESFPTTLNAGQRATLARLGVRWVITPTGIDELPGAAHPPAPSNDPPAWLGWGVAVTALGLVLAVLAAVKLGSHLET
jgi:hypothetical protein